MGFSLSSLNALNPTTWMASLPGVSGGLGGLFGEQQQQNQTSVQSNQLPAYLQPYANQIAAQSQQNYQSGGPQYYPGQTVAPFSSDTQNALNMLQKQATQPNQMLGNAQNQINQTLTGQGYSQPDFMNAFKSAYNQINPQVDSAFSLASRSGSGLHEAAKTEALGNAYGGLYNNERARQIQASSMAPALDQSNYYGINQLLQGGGMQQQQAQDVLGGEMARYNYGQNAPQQNLQTYLGNISGLAGNYGTQTANNPIYRNQAAGMLGGALGGGSLGFMMGGPVGAGIGALGGGILGRA